MVGNNEITQLMKIVEQMQTRLNESGKKIELITATLQSLIRNTPNEKGEKPCNRWEEDDKKKEEKGEKWTPQNDPRADRKGYLLKESSMLND